MELREWNNDQYLYSYFPWRRYSQNSNIVITGWTWIKCSAMAGAIASEALDANINTMTISQWLEWVGPYIGLQHNNIRTHLFLETVDKFPIKYFLRLLKFRSRYSVAIHRMAEQFKHRMQVSTIYLWQCEDLFQFVAKWKQKKKAKMNNKRKFNMNSKK